MDEVVAVILERKAYESHTDFRFILHPHEINTADIQTIYVELLYKKAVFGPLVLDADALESLDAKVFLNDKGNQRMAHYSISVHPRFRVDVRDYTYFCFSLPHETGFSADADNAI